MKALIVLVIGVIIGAVAVLYLTTDEPENNGLEARLEALQLRADDIRDELAQEGRIVRQRAREISGDVYDTATDLRITATIQSKLATDSDLSVFDISVSTSDGRVTLTGTVESPEQIGRATALALDTEDVREVVSMISVR